jgi:hypothetical protein
LPPRTIPQGLWRRHHGGDDAPFTGVPHDHLVVGDLGVVTTDAANCIDQQPEQLPGIRRIGLGPVRPHGAPETKQLQIQRLTHIWRDVDDSGDAGDEIGATGEIDAAVAVDKASC